MKNKKGFLLAEETLKIILAVISISFLIYFLTALYFANQGNKELEQAEASLEFLIKEINDGRKQVEIYNPEGWWISSWPHENENKLPNLCNKNGWKECLCICESKEIESCKEKGMCKESDFSVKGDRIRKSTLQIENPPLNLEINFDTKEIIKK